MTRATEQAWSMTADIVVYPCATSRCFLASLKRPKNRIMITVISRKKAMSDVTGAFPSGPDMPQK